MGRASVMVKCSELQNAIDTVESTSTFNNVGDLCKAISNTDWANGIKNSKHRVVGLSPQMVYIKIRELKCTYKTKAGKRGLQVGQKVKKTNRSDKLSTKLSTFSKSLIDEVPDNYKHLAQKALEGNTSACIRLMCGQCMGYSGAEKACTGCISGTPCAIYPMNLLLYPNRRQLVEDKDGFYITKKLDKPDVSTEET